MNKSIEENTIKNDFLKIILRERQDLKEFRSKYQRRRRKRNLMKYKEKLLDLYTDVRPLVLDKINEEDETHLKELDNLLKGLKTIDQYGDKPFEMLNILSIELDKTLYDIGILDPFKDEIKGGEHFEK